MHYVIFIWRYNMFELPCELSIKRCQGSQTLAPYNTGKYECVDSDIAIQNMHTFALIAMIFVERFLLY